LRHTCASRLVQAGIDLRRVQTFLGHQTIQMTLRYAHLATNDLAQCAAALDARTETAAHGDPDTAAEAEAPEAARQPAKPSRASSRKSASPSPSVQTQRHA
ncbi:MAG: tyrosine-type recombinase/integrase, partial [Pararhizobium sp.]